MNSDSGSHNAIVAKDDLILVTGAAGFIGERVLERLIARGFRNLRCFRRPAGNQEKLTTFHGRHQNQARIEIVTGNLLSKDDCRAALKGVKVVYHLAAGRGEKLVADAFLNSVVTTRNLIQACADEQIIKRFINISSFSVYSNCQKPRGRLLDESCPLEQRPELRGDAYTFAKIKQDQLVMNLCARLKVPWVIVRPGVVYGPGNEAVLGRVGLGSFGVFLHLGGSNLLPLTYVDNCADAIVLAGMSPGVDGEIFNVVDDELPTSRRFLRLYKKNVKAFKSVYLPHALSYLLCYLWEKYSDWSYGQLPPVYGRRTWHAYWKKTKYTNLKAKTRLGWKPIVAREEAFARFFESCRRKSNHA